jgi:hypothetical protein
VKSILGNNSTWLNKTGCLLIIPVFGGNFPQSQLIAAATIRTVLKPEINIRNDFFLFFNSRQPAIMISLGQPDAACAVDFSDIDGKVTV